MTTCILEPSIPLPELGASWRSRTPVTIHTEKWLSVLSDAPAFIPFGTCQDPKDAAFFSEEGQRLSAEAVKDGWFVRCNLAARPTRLWMYLGSGARKNHADPADVWQDENEVTYGLA